MIPYGKHEINSTDIKSVVNVLKNLPLTQGELVPNFESSINQYCGSKYSVATNSATSALHLACLALGIGEHDYVWTTPISFVATSNAALYCGAKIDFIDINPNTFNLSVQELEKKLVYAQKANKLPKLVIVVHLSGHPCDLKKIHSLALKYSFKIIEDASHAIGSSIKNYKIGACKYSDVTIFSFHPVKIITTGEGGIATTNNKKIANLMYLLRSHGITKKNNEFKNKSDGPWYYEQIALGYNYRMTEIQAALGISQLKKLDSFVQKRNEIAELFRKKLADSNFKFQELLPNTKSSYHIFIIKFPEYYNKNHLANFLISNGIQVSSHYIPIYKHPYYRTLGFSKDYCPNAENYYKTTLTIPLYPQLTNSMIKYILDCLNLYGRNR